MGPSLRHGVYPQNGLWQKVVRAVAFSTWELREGWHAVCSKPNEKSVAGWQTEP